MNTTEYAGDDVLEIMSRYAQNRNRSIEKLIVKHLKFDRTKLTLKVLEFGAGRGEFIMRFIPRPNLELIAVEIDPTYLNNLSSKVKVFSSIDDVPADLDAIYLIDVLEHLEDDRYFLKRFHEKLKPGGRIFIYVPARMELYSAFDKSIGHFRRYTLNELKEKVREGGFTIEISRYHELLGYFASMLNKMTNKKGDLNAGAVKVYDKFLVPATNVLEKFVRVPVGKSIYLSATRNF